MIMNCTCKNAYQDKLYGVGKRVFNPMGKERKRARCTSCEAIIDIKSDEVVKPKKEK